MDEVIVIGFLVKLININVNKDFLIMKHSKTICYMLYLCLLVLKVYAIDPNINASNIKRLGYIIHPMDISIGTYNSPTPSTYLYPRKDIIKVNAKFQIDNLDIYQKGNGIEIKFYLGDYVNYSSVIGSSELKIKATPIISDYCKKNNYDDANCFTFTKIINSIDNVYGVDILVVNGQTQCYSNIDRCSIFNISFFTTPRSYYVDYTNLLYLAIGLKIQNFQRNLITQTYWNTPSYLTSQLEPFDVKIKPCGKTIMDLKQNRDSDYYFIKDGQRYCDFQDKNDWEQGQILHPIDTYFYNSSTEIQVYGKVEIANRVLTSVPHQNSFLSVRFDVGKDDAVTKLNGIDFHIVNNCSDQDTISDKCLSVSPLSSIPDSTVYSSEVNITNSPCEDSLLGCSSINFSFKAGVEPTSNLRYFYYVYDDETDLFLYHIIFGAGIFLPNLSIFYDPTIYRCQHGELDLNGQLMLHYLHNNYYFIKDKKSICKWEGSFKHTELKIR